MNENEKGDAVFFFQYYSKPDSSPYNEKTVFIYDAPYREEGEDLEVDIYGGEGTVSSIGVREDRLTLLALREKLEELSTEIVTCLALSIEEDDTWKTLNDESWRLFCRACKDLLVDVTTLEIEESHNLGDDKLKILFQHFESKPITKLSLGGGSGDLPKSYRCIATAVSHLECLEVVGCGPRGERSLTFSEKKRTKSGIFLGSVTKSSKNHNRGLCHPKP